jgi:hypothetical protein
VTAQADDLQFAPDALAVIAAIFFLVGGKAGAGRIPAFFGAGHDPPLSVRSVPSSFVGTGKFGAATDAEDSSSNSYANTSKISGCSTLIYS